MKQPVSSSGRSNHREVRAMVVVGEGGDHSLPTSGENAKGLLALGDVDAIPLRPRRGGAVVRNNFV